MKSPRATMCDAVRNRLVNDLARTRELPAEVRAHLAECRECQSIAEEWSQVLTARREDGAAELPESVVDRMWTKFEPSVDRLIDGRKKRWWSSLWPAHGAGRWLWAGALAAGAATVVFALQPTSTPDRSSPAPELAQVFLQRGQVEIVQGARVHAVPTGTPAALAVTEVLRTGPDGEARLQARAHRVVVRAQSELALATLAGAEIGFELRRGSALVAVDPGERTRLWVRSPRGMTEVTGTVFAVETSAIEDIVTVVRGSVHVTASLGGQTASVTAGSRAHVTEQGIRVEALGGADDTVATTPATTPRSPGQRNRTLTTIDELLMGGDCEGALRAARSPTLRLDISARAEALMLVADCHLGARALDKALVLYEEIARSYARTPQGQNATYESGRVAIELGDRDGAMRSFATYLKRYPRGALAPEALYRACILHVEAGHADEALSCLRQYRRQHAKATRAHEALLTEANIQRTLKQDCAAAIRLYDQYLQDDGEEAEQARKWRAWCEARMAR